MPRSTLFASSILAIAVLLSPAPTFAQPASAMAPATAARALPDDTRGRCIRDYIQLANQPTAERVAAFESAYASSVRRNAPGRTAETRLKSTRELHDRWGDVTLGEVLVVGEDVVSVILTPAHGEPVAAEFGFSSTETGKLDEIIITAATEQAVSGPLTSQTRAEVVERAASLLAKNYVYPEQGAKMAALVRANLEAGKYDAIVDEVGLARRLTADFRSISNDKHLRIRLDPARAPASEADASPAAPAPAQRPAPGGDNFGFKKVEILPGNVGYLRLDGFAEGADAQAVASGAMAFLAGASAIVFDMRFNGGGSPEMVRYITSYLFDQKTHLNDMFDRKGRKIEEYWTLEELPGRRVGAAVPVYILTSSYTFSGAEEFTYNLKSLKRATIVGETTGGGAHPVRRMRIDDRFIIGVPHMRACNPITGTNWEGVGVEPDIKCSADEALDRALEAARARK